jgi:ComF family protein
MHGHLYTTALQFLFPSHCIGCGRVGQYVCAFCKIWKLPHQHQQVCHVCKQNAGTHFMHQECMEYSWLSGVHVSCIYTGLAKKMVSEMKFNFSYTIGETLTDIIVSSPALKNLVEDSVLTYVPTSRRRLWWRGFNQSHLLAKGISSRARVECKQLLRRSSHSRPQVGLSRAERLVGQLGNYELTYAQLDSNIRQIVIVDDVMTTGATLEACAKVLALYYRLPVYAAVFGRG